jgi:hypothetical protein
VCIIRHKLDDCQDEREERCSIEHEEVFLDHPTHQVRYIDVHPITESSFEAVPIDEYHKELEILLLAIVRCGPHQEESVNLILLHK